MFHECSCPQLCAFKYNAKEASRNTFLWRVPRRRRLKSEGAAKARSLISAVECHAPED
jgi:hypothetical protein